MAKLTRYYNSPYFNQYSILQYVRINDVYVTSQIIHTKYISPHLKDKITSTKDTRMVFKNHNNMVTHINAIRNAVKEYWDSMNEEDVVPRFVIFIDKESYNSHPMFTNEYYTECIEFRVYNAIVPGYTTCIPDLSINTFNKQLEMAIKEIIYYVNSIGLINYIDKIVIKAKAEDGTKKIQNVSFAYASRRWLEKDTEFKDIVKHIANTNMLRNRYPDYNFVRECIPDIKQFNANKLVCHGKEIRFKKVCKYDIDSSFWVNPCIEYTGQNPRKVQVDEYGLTKDGDTLLDIITEPDSMYIAKIRINDLLIAKDDKVNWIELFNIDLINQSMYVTNVEIHDILNTYNIKLEDIELEEVYMLERTPFTTAQRDFYKQLHKRKAEAKQNGETLLKMCLKVIGHSLHGYALGNWFTEQDNLKAYLSISTINKRGKRSYANHLLTPIDSMYLYSYSRSHLLKILDLFGDNFYYDTDSIVTEPNDKALKAYNEWIDSKYKAMGLDSKDYTHDGHTMGYLELEEVCDNFCHFSPKFYLWTNNGKLHSTTAGYLKDSIADKIEEISGLKGTDALKWFIEQKYIKLDLGYISNGKKYIKSNFEYKKRTD